jgi:phage terminase large subunit
VVIRQGLPIHPPFSCRMMPEPKPLASGGKSIVEQLAAHLGGISKLAIVPEIGVQDGIQAVRMILPICYFDSRCDEGLEALRQYQREYDEDKKTFRQTPRHDWCSHPADAFRMLGSSL